MPDDSQANKPHNARKAGPKSDKSRKKHAQSNNPKAFAFNSVRKAERAQRRSMDVAEKRLHVPQADRSAVEPPPIIIAVVGPPHV